MVGGVWGGEGLGELLRSDLQLGAMRYPVKRQQGAYGRETATGGHNPVVARNAPQSAFDAPFIEIPCDDRWIGFACRQNKPKMIELPTPRPSHEAKVNANEPERPDGRHHVGNYSTPWFQSRKVDAIHLDGIKTPVGQNRDPVPAQAVLMSLKRDRPETSQFGDAVLGQRSRSFSQPEIRLLQDGDIGSEGFDHREHARRVSTPVCPKPGADVVAGQTKRMICDNRHSIYIQVMPLQLEG